MATRTQTLRPRFSAGWGAVISLIGYLAAHLMGAGGLRFVFGLLLVAFGSVAAWKLLARWRSRLLWRLRNRLIVTYLFIAVIPILLILGMVALTSYLLFGQLAGYLIANELASRAAELNALNFGSAGELEAYRTAGGLRSPALRRLLERREANLRRDFPNLRLVLSAGDESLAATPASGPDACLVTPNWVEGSFHDVVFFQDKLFLHAVAPVPGWREATLCATVPVDEPLLAQVGPGIGRFSLLLLEEREATPAEGPVFVFAERPYVPGTRIEPQQQPLPASEYLFDPELNSVSKFNAVLWGVASGERQEIPVLVSITTRPSLLNERIFAPLGEVARALLAVLFAIGVLFLLLQVVSLITGVRLTRSVTTAVHDLYTATERVRAGDLSVRIAHRRDDQLGALSRSFNEMAASIERLLAESTEKQRLQSELEIARQVQDQLFPRTVPQLETLELFGRCRAARTVSGDYYDFGLAGPGRLIFTIGDISGKGISAALLMASIQSALRSQVYTSRLFDQPEKLAVAELVTRVNRQLCATSSLEKYSTLFVGSYDDRTRQLTYTNSGHLPPLVLGRRGRRSLGVGGPVVGVFDDATYEQETVQLEQGDWLVAYTDGLTEAENSYEEEFGSQRLLAFIERNLDHTTPERLIAAVLAELQEWAPGVEQGDDRTLLVAHVR